MRVLNEGQIIGTEREVHCPNGGFISLRYLLQKDGMGFGLHRTIVLPGKPHRWHYKHHLEACFCVEGQGLLTDITTGEKHLIYPQDCYVLDNHDEHTFEALKSPCVLISVFNPPVTGTEVHREDGSYAPE